MSKPEAMLWIRLKTFRALGFHVRRQASIGRYFADFACHAVRLVIEVDGSQHNEPAAWAHDQARDRWFAAQGFETIRFDARDVLKQPDAVADQVLTRLRARRDSPTPPLRGVPSP